MATTLMGDDVLERRVDAKSLSCDSLPGMGVEVVGVLILNVAPSAGEEEEEEEEGEVVVEGDMRSMMRWMGMT